MKPAIKDLMDDHQVILRMLRVLNGMCLCLDAMRPSSAASVPGPKGPGLRENP